MSVTATTAAPGGIIASLGYITEAQLASDLNVIPKTLANHRAAGTGPRFIKRGRTVLYRPEAIREWLEAGE
jgi:hypothetical protein